MAYYYLQLDEVINLHDYAIEQSGGLHGTKDIGMIESILDHIQNDDYYPDLIDKLCHLFFAINKGHAFNDGNKRASITVSAYFLEINGFGVLVSSFIGEFENIAVCVADNLVCKDFLRDMLEEFVYGDGFSESTKLRLIAVLGRTTT
jgi:death-on-curing protein